jgi:hypothetical protein
MRIVLSILLLVVTALYVLPVKELLCDETISVSMADADEEKNENKKKEKEIVFYSFADKFSLGSNEATPITFHYYYNIPVLLHTVETPPPNRL